MPTATAALAAKLTAVGVAALTSVGFSAATATAIVSVGAKLAGLAILGKVASLFANDVADISSSKSGHQLTFRSTTEYRRIVYGEALVSGPIIYQNTAGERNDLLFGLVALAGHEIEDITDVWLDDVQIEDSDIDWAGDGSVDAGVFRGKTDKDPVCFFEKGLGTSTQAASSFLSTYFTEWTSEHRGRGIAYLAVRFDYLTAQEKVYERGAPGNWKGLVKGAKVYDPRLDSTQTGGSGTHRVDDAATWAWSDNPALCTADYIRNEALGMGEDHARIDWELVMDAADVCDVLVDIPGALGTTEKRYTCNGALACGTDHGPNIEALASSFNGTVIYSNGKWRIRAWEYLTPGTSLTTDDARDDLRLMPNLPLADRYNMIRAIYTDPLRQYKPSEMIPVISASFAARDGETLPRDIELPLTDGEYMAQRLATGLLNASDYQKTLRFPGKWRCYPINIGETVTVTHDPYNWSAKVFRVVGYKLTPDGPDLLLREDASTIYSDMADTDYGVRNTAGVITFPSEVVPMLEDFVANSEARGAALSWTSPAHRAYDVVEIYRALNASWDNAEFVGESRSNRYFDEVAPGHYYYFGQGRNYVGEVSTRTPLNGAEVAIVPDDFLVIDPGFEMTKLGVVDKRHWLSVATITVGGDGTASMVVGSGDGAHGGGHKLEVELTVHPNESQLFSFPNAKTPALARGLTLNAWVRYRVPTYSNLNSAYIDVNISGRRSARDGTSQTIGTDRITIPNSVGWSVHSWQIAVAGLTNVESFSLMRGALQFTGHATANTGTLALEVDEFFINYV